MQTELAARIKIFKLYFTDLFFLFDTPISQYANRVGCFGAETEEKMTAKLENKQISTASVQLD
jgi:hypothetical protein